MIKAAKKSMPFSNSLVGYSVSETGLVASLCRTSFFDFVKEFWEIVIPEAPVYNWHVEYLCNEIQEVLERVFVVEKKKYDLLVNIPPGTTKSTIASVMLPAWVWTRMPTARGIFGSFAADLSLDLSRKTRDIILSEKYINAFPDIVLRNDQNTKSYFINTKGGWRKAVGTGNMITGFHGHYHTIDDPIDPKAALSEADLKATNSWMNETLSTRKVNKEVCPLILIMQRLHQNDPSGNLMERMEQGRKVKHICLPGELTAKVSPVELRERYVDGLLDPIRLTRSVLAEQEDTLGQYGYAGQILQHPIPPGGGMFKIDRLWERCKPAPDKLVQSVRYWDKAATPDAGCYTVGFKMGVDKEGNYWILDVQRFQKSSEEREKIIEAVAASDGKDVLIGLEQEPGSGGKESVESTVRRLAGYRMRVDRPTGDKTLRADPFSVQVNKGNVYMTPNAWNTALLSEMEYFPHSTYKDQVDAGSGAFNLLSKPRIKVGAL